MLAGLLTNIRLGQRGLAWGKHSGLPANALAYHVVAEFFAAKKIYKIVEWSHAKLAP